MELVQIRIKRQEGDYGDYYNYEFAIIKERGSIHSVFDLVPDIRNIRSDDNEYDRYDYTIPNNDFKSILFDHSK